MTQILENLVWDRGNEPIEYQGFSAFTKHHLPKFDGKFNLEGAQRWITEIENIFNAMGCHEEHKVITSMLWHRNPIFMWHDTSITTMDVNGICGLLITKSDVTGKLSLLTIDIHVSLH